MRAVSARELLDIWDVGSPQPPAQRALLLLAAANPDMSDEALARMRIGRRDAQLLMLRERLFGPQLVSVASCPSCEERLQLTLISHDLYAEAGDVPESIALMVDDYRIHYRLPDSTDLLALAQYDTVASGRDLLLRRCLQRVIHNDRDQPIEALPAHVIESIAAHMAQAAACRHQWLATFDVVTFFWNEIEGWAQRIVHDIHVLASAYSWSEADILALSPARRQRYLDLIGTAI